MSLCRSWLVTPGDEPPMVAKAPDGAAEGICLGLAETVAPGDRKAGWPTAPHRLSVLRGGRGRAPRISSLRTADVILRLTHGAHRINERSSA